MKFILAIAYREYRIRLTNPIFPLWDVLVPVVYLVVFGASLEQWLDVAASGVSYPTFFLGGVVSMVTFSIAMNSSYAYFEDVQSGIFHELLTYPFPRRDLLIGKLLFNAAFSVVGALTCLAAAVLVLRIPLRLQALPALMLWTVVGTAAWYFLFSWIAIHIRGFNAYHTTSSGLYLVLMFISNLFYPTDRLPAWVQWAAWANPISWQTDLLRHHIYGAGDMVLLQYQAFGLATFVLLCFWMANRALNAPAE